MNHSHPSEVPPVKAAFFQFAEECVRDPNVGTFRSTRELFTGHAASPWFLLVGTHAPAPPLRIVVPGFFLPDLSCPH